MPIVNVYSTSVTSDNISRFELLAWVNDCLQSNLTKIEEMASGAAYCQLTDFLIPNHVQLKKVKWNSRQEVDWMNNWRVLQHAWKEIGIDRPVPVQNLMRAKFQDNFEFLQWFKRLFDANYDGHEYDPQAARNFEEFPAALPAGANRRKMPAAAPPLARTTTVTSTTSRRSMFGTGPSAGRPQSATTTRKPPIPSSRLSIMPKGPTAAAAGARAQDGASDRKMNGAQGTTTTTRGRQSIGVKKLTSNAAEKTTTTANTTLLGVTSPRRRVTSSSASSSATITKKQEQRPIASPRQQAEAQKRNGQHPQQKLQQKEYEKQIVELQAQVNELRHQLEFTNGKLAQIEALCAAAKPGASVSVEQLQQIILDRNMFVGKSDGHGNASSPEPRGDAIPPPLDSPDERQLHELMGMAAAAANMNTGKSTTSENTEQLVTQIGGEGDASVVVGEGDGRQVQAAAAAKSEAQNSSTQQQNTSMGADLMDMDTAHLEDAFLDLSMGSGANTSNNDGLRQLLFSNNSEGGNVGSDVAPVAALLPEQPHEEQQEEEMRQSLLNNTFDIVPGEHNEEEELINVTHPVVSENEQALLEITHLTNGADISNMVAPPEEEENILNTTYDTERTADQGFTHMMDSDNGTPMTEGGGDGSATGVNQTADLSGGFISSSTETS